MIVTFGFSSIYAWWRLSIISMTVTFAFSSIYAWWRLSISMTVTFGFSSIQMQIVPEVFIQMAI
jgi:hypothetical protein